MMIYTCIYIYAYIRDLELIGGVLNMCVFSL